MRPVCCYGKHHSLSDNGQFELKEKCSQGVLNLMGEIKKGCSSAASLIEKNIDKEHKYY